MLKKDDYKMDDVILPVEIITYIHEDGEGMKIYYPQVRGLSNSGIERRMNEKIVDTVNELIEEQYREQNAQSFAQMLGTYELKTNERNILSFTFSNYAIQEFAAHGLTLMKSLTFNIRTGMSYDLAQLFKPDSNYVEVLSNMVKRQIEERDISLLEPFTSIRPDQNFYIADKALVLYFQQYEISPYYVGLPMFPISVFELTDIMRDYGPLSIMATND